MSAAAAGAAGIANGSCCLVLDQERAPAGDRATRGWLGGQAEAARMEEGRQRHT